MSNTYLAGEQTKRNILRESKKLFYKKGYTETTYTDISAVAKVNRALIPYHFKNKQVLGLEIYNQIIDEFYELIDDVLDTSQFDTDFVSILHTVAYYRLLASNKHFLQFLSELQSDEDAALFNAAIEQEWLTSLGSKFANLDEVELTILTQMNIGMKKESITMLATASKELNADTIAHMHLHMLMRYVGYSAKKADELINATTEIVNLLNFQIKNGFVIELKYN